ncbi:MAG: hypothetical protein N2316_06705 [Spirochaetes bacterium]|nr:hypothetical protein [Spirochaetota bacterium]
MKARKFLHLVIFVLVAHALLADDTNIGHPEIRASCSIQKTTIGVPFEYRVVIAGKGVDVKVRMPDKRVVYPDATKTIKSDHKMKDDSAQPDSNALKVPLYVIKNARKEESKSGDVVQLSIVIEIAYFHPGKHRLPEVELFDSENVKIGYRIPEIEIESVNPQGEFHEIEPPLALSGNWWRVVWLILGICAVGAVGYFFARWWNARKAHSQRVFQTPPIEIFLEEAGKLARKKHIEEGRVREYVFEMSAIFRRFLVHQWQIDAMDMTVTEIRKALQNVLPRPMFKKNESDIDAVLNLWDLAKFAEFSPSQETLKDNFEITVRVAKNLAGAGSNVVA